MAIMTRCCCFDNVRSGSTAAGIYTLIYSALSLGVAAYLLMRLAEIGFNAKDPWIIGCYVGIGFESLVLLSSILLLVGISKDQRGYLVPYMIVMVLWILMGIAKCIIIIIALAENKVLSDYNNTSVRTTYFSMLVTILLFTVLNVFCFLCVVSQHQELRDGRGRLQDVIDARTHVIFTNSSVVGSTVVVTQQGGHPMGYAPQQQAYPSESYAGHQAKPPAYYPGGVYTA